MPGAGQTVANWLKYPLHAPEEEGVYLAIRMHLTLEEIAICEWADDDWWAGYEGPLDNVVAFAELPKGLHKESEKDES